MKKTAVLGAEHDEALAVCLRRVLMAEGAEPIGKWSAVVGSQDITAGTFKIGKEELHIEAETYVGLSITGPQELVDRIAAAIKDKSRR